MMAHNPEKTPWLPEMTPPADLSEYIMAAIMAEPAPPWEAAAKSASTTKAMVKPYRLRTVWPAVLVLVGAFILLLPTLPGFLWTQYKSAAELMMVAGRIFRLAAAGLTFLAVLAQSLLTAAVRIGNVYIDVAQTVISGPLYYWSMAALTLTMLGDAALVRIIVGRRLLPKS